VFHPKHGFPAYYASPRSAVYDLLGENESNNVRVSVAGDWGTGTDEAEVVADQMVAFNPHFTIHLGDVYYVGDPPEVNENCLGIPNPNNHYTPVKITGRHLITGRHFLSPNFGCSGGKASFSTPTCGYTN
jgi:hypothetical protein